MTAKFSGKFGCIVLLFTLVLMVFIKGCNEDQSGPTTSNQEDGLALKIFANPETQAKLTGLTLDIVGLTQPGQTAVPQLSRNISTCTNQHRAITQPASVLSHGTQTSADFRDPFSPLLMLPEHSTRS